MKYRDENGVFQDLYLPPTGDTLPIGSEVDYNGSTVPYGWEEVTNPESYSTTEVKTNKTWKDGKPIYRKVIEGTLPSLQPSSGGTVDGNVAHGISNFDSLVSISGRMLYSDVWYEFPILSSNEKMTAIKTVNSTNIVLRAADSWGSGPSLVFILEYTKTTD